MNFQRTWKKPDSITVPHSESHGISDFKSKFSIGNFWSKLKNTRAIAGEQDIESQAGLMSNEEVL
ncbi:CBK_G0011360.mRNA.1.CDS.1 [Saccharomyces cerevisiae]|nr:CBK_G0011360.mRNA.1.CDS.1 [Saccharomyces cerevisiae]CAI7214523.1 CBK_G0011360.mRNA.1.CDS.1 [Saccharomyces cerevisiae]